MRATVLLLSAGLSGCAGDIWYNPNIENDLVQRQFAIDSNYCLSVAYGTVPMPPLRVYSSGHQGPYYFTGTATTYTRNGPVYTDFSGSADSYQRADVAGSMANGYAVGSAIAAENQRAVVQGNCLVGLGWTTNQKAADAAKARMLAAEQESVEP
jgi:hypothetical protein